MLLCSKTRFYNYIASALIPSLTHFRFQYALLRTSCVACAGGHKNTKRVIIRPVVFKKKSTQPKPDVVEIKKSMTVTELASLLNRTTDQIFEAMMGLEASRKYKKTSSEIDDLTVLKEIVKRCGYRFKFESAKQEQPNVEESFTLKRNLPNPEKMVPRPPVITIMGHVDHGKTTLLDSLRKSNIVAQEFGGITQHIGAFSVKLPSGQSVTFLDTPGHAVFSSMRARGASVTDIVVLVVAADDGVMQQTEESIKFAVQAGVPIIVAINKVDKSKIDIEKTKLELLQHNIQLEDHGGDIQSVPISALKGTNLDLLLDCILAQAEMMDLKADLTCHVEGVCIESKTHSGRGKLATALVQHGVLKKGKFLVAGGAWAKVRGLFNDQGRPVETAMPGMPVEIDGWKVLPSAGEKIFEVDTEQEAKQCVDKYIAKETEKEVQATEEIVMQKMEKHKQFYNEMRSKKLALGWRAGSAFGGKRSKETQPDDPTPKLSIIVKGDVDGSVEAILDILGTYSSDMCRLDLISYGVGEITENEVEMAGMSQGVIYTFNTNTSEKITALAKEKGVQILSFNVIYRLISDLIKKLNDKLPYVEKDEIIGEAKVLANFTVTEGKKKISVAGCRCIKGQLNRKRLFKLIRNDEVIMEGSLMSLKHFKKEVDTIDNDAECGISFSNQKESPQPGDTIICIEKVSMKQKIDWGQEFV